MNLPCRIMLGVLSMSMALRAEGIAYGDPKDWSLWKQFRSTVQHPCTLIKKEDLVRARENCRQHAWARAYKTRLLKSADAICGKLTPAYLENMAEPTTPGCTGPCPACRDQGKRWHPNGQWRWRPSDPNHLVCEACGTVFPNKRYPESVRVQSTWDPKQVYTFMGGETFRCFSYTKARPSISGIIRARKFLYLASQLETLGYAYALSENPEYAAGAKAILLRIAEVFPNYTVRAGYGYGEYADCDPHTAAEHINDLPKDELVYPPNKPDRRIHTGYWSASRVGTSGMDGGWVIRVTVAYDLTCEAKTADDQPVYSEAERLRIERDVLLEGSYLAACDVGINNKSVGNRAGAAIVGLCIGHPDLVRFGLDGFVRTVDNWFLPDGTTSESAAYGMMTMGGIRSFAVAFRDYSEPDAYHPPDDRPLRHFNACRDTRYGMCWQGLIWTLQGDLHHPPIADSYKTTGISSYYAELIALCYPTPEHRAFLAAVTGGRPPSGSAAKEAVFYRDPALQRNTSTPFTLPDVVFPYLCQGYLRSGPHGRRSALVLNASDWGGHHHHDSLDLVYWKQGHELLSDLGYLWDHPDKPKTYRTAAHNLVLIDGREQRTRDRGGTIELFSTTPRFKAMEAWSAAYEQANIYRRTVVWLEHDNGRDYVVDIFRAGGGKHRDCLFHGPGTSYTITGWNPDTPTGKDRPAPSLPLELKNIRQGDGKKPWSITWKLDRKYEFTAHMPACPEETIVVGDGWGQRDHRNRDIGAVLPYILRSRSGEGSRPDIFVTVFEGAETGSSIVKRVRLVPLTGDAASGAIGIAVDTIFGTDLLVSNLRTAPVECRDGDTTLRTDARLAACLNQADHATLALVGGTTLTLGDYHLEAPTARLHGLVRRIGGKAGESWVDIDRSLPPGWKMRETTLFVTDDKGRIRAYPVRDAQPATADTTRLFTKTDYQGFDLVSATEWTLYSTSTCRLQKPATGKPGR